jgi:signal transduction histidine kinase
VELAGKTAHLDLDRLDVAFETDREDEIGGLSRLLGEMTERLRASAATIRDAERRATRGEMARQVNHDIRNGLTPIRNVFRHLVELAQHNPGKLAEIFHERERTLASSIDYLDELATNYARLSERGDPRPCDLNEIARQVASSFGSADGVEVRTRLAERAIVRGDAVSLRRVVENLVDNAIDSLDGGRGSVTIGTDWVFDDDGASRLQLTVADTGHGMTEAEMDRIFEDFYTGKEGGTGLGLSIVRRIVMDLQGTIRVQSTPGEGTSFTVRVPPGDPGRVEENV